MKKTLIAVGLATAMTVSAGLAVASAQEVTDDTPTTVVDQDRDQVRDCDLYDGDAVVAQDGELDRDQDRDRDVVAEWDPDQIRDQDRNCDLCDGDGDGDGAQVQERERERVGADGSAGVGHGQGVVDGTGPLQDGPEDGAGNQFGPGGR